MPAHTCDNGILRIRIGRSRASGRGAFSLASVELATAAGWQPLLEAWPGQEFATSLGAIAAETCEARRSEAGEWVITMAGQGEGWGAREVIRLPAGEPFLRREQTYRFSKACEAAIFPGFRLRAAEGIRYTYALRAHEQSLRSLPSLRAATDWALPFPFHVWHNDEVVALYGLDKSVSAGTLEFTPVDADGCAGVRVTYPDAAVLDPEFPAAPRMPETRRFEAGEEITLTEVIAARPLAPDEEPLLEAERLAALLLLRAPARPADLERVAAGIAVFYERCDLWEPDALGPGRGWFSNMWVRTQTGPAQKRGEMSGYFDLGWGEGIAVEMWLGMLRHWQRTGDARLLRYVDEMTRNMDLFRRGTGPDAPYFDRSDGQRFGDFLMDVVPGSRIWTHSLGHSGSHLLQLYQAAPHYPCPETRERWLSAAAAMARFLGQHQRPDGDLQDIFDEHDREGNRKPHRITARAVVCGLWTRLAEVAGDDSWLDRARRLASAVAPEIQRYECYNQMLDGVASPHEFVDGEAAYYVLEGLVPLYAATRDPAVLALCRKAAAFALAWTYWYDLPKAHNGVARGGQCCRMDDYPLLYPIGPAKGVEPLLALSRATGDPFYRQMAGEMATFLGHWQVDAPGRPWHGGMVHALAQYSGRHWGPGLAGQVDTGMATGNALAAIEAWMSD